MCGRFSRMCSRPICLGVSRGYPGCPDAVGRSFQMSRSDQEVLPDVRKWSGSLPDEQEVHPDVREVFSDVREWLGGTPGWPGVVARSPRCQGVVGRPSWMTESGLQTLPDKQKVHPDVREVFQDVREWWGVTPGCPGLVGRPSRISGSGRETLPDIR